jgi:hypothetical protein
MKQNVMCISVRRDITSVGIYETAITKANKLEKINVIWYEELKGKRISEVADKVIHISKMCDVSGCIVECIGSGVAIKDYLKVNDEFSPTIYKMCCLPQTSAYKSENLYKTSRYIQDNMIEITNLAINAQLSEYKINVSGVNGRVDLKSSEYDDFFSNLTFFIGTIDPILINTDKVKNREKIELNLKEIVEILVEDLANIDKADYKEVNELVRLIDKVNYIRGQY